MHIAPSLLDLQTDFLAALYGDQEATIADQLVGAGLAPAARLRIYRHSTEQIHLDALRTIYSALSALVGEAFFEQAAAAYHRGHPSCSGNLQAFGEHFPDFLEGLPNTRALPYLGDVARLEWRRQVVALAAEYDSLSLADFDTVLAAAEGTVRITFQPGMQCWISPYPVLAIWRYATQPTPERLVLSTSGDHMVLWRSEVDVAMAGVDVASFACIDALVRGDTLDTAYALARALDPAFDLPTCITSLVDAGLVTAITPSRLMEHAACADFNR